MFKKLLLLAMFTSVLINMNLFKVQATMDDYPDPFSYYSNGDGKTHYLYSTSFFKIPANPTYFELYIPRTNYNAYSTVVDGITYQSWFHLYDENLSGKLTIPLENLDPYRESWGSYIMDQATLQSFNIDDYAYFGIEMIQTYAGIANPLYVEWFNERFEFSFNVEIEHDGINEITYQIGDVLYYKYLYNTGEIPDKPIDPDYPNLKFLGWYLEDGTLYDFTNPIPFNPMLIDVILSAKFVFKQPAGTDGTNDNTPSAFTNILTIIGFNNTTGKLIIFILTIVVITVLSLWLKLEAFIIMIVDTLVFSLFIFLGWLPLYAIIILGIVFLTGVIKTLNKGGV